MQLQITDLVPAHLREAPITDVVACRVFFLVTGRNSWNGNWSSRYAKSSSFHSTLLAAQLSAERQRTQGSTFSIFERPAIRLLTETGKLIAIHINNSEPFLAWRARPTQSGWWRPRFSLDSTATAGTVMGALSMKSDHWDPYLAENETVLFAPAALKDPFLFLAGRRLRAWASSPMGTHRYLGWVESNNAVSPKGAYQAQGLMTRRLELSSRRTRMAT